MVLQEQVCKRNSIMKNHFNDEEGISFDIIDIKNNLYDTIRIYTRPFQAL